MEHIWTHILAPGIPLLEKAFRTVAVYAFLLLSLRLAGKRELVQLNPFDLVVLLLLSNTLQNAIIGEDNSVLGGIFGAALLLAINAFAVRFLYRHPHLEEMVEGKTEVLIEDGAVKGEVLEKNAITTAELEAAARRQGIAHLDEVAHCCLEVGGALTFIQRQPSDEEKRHQELVERLARLEAHLSALAPVAQA
jgi:uncharacterized membrane protein YcaP (DUF421 family)